MSMRAWTEDGYGFTIDRLTKTGDNLERSVKTAEDFKPVLKFICDNLDLVMDADSEPRDEIYACRTPYEYYEFMDQYPSETIAEIINRREGTSCFSGFPPDETSYVCRDLGVRIISEERVGVAKCFPWQFNKNDKVLSEEDLRGILVKYAKMLGITQEPEIFSAEYCG